MLKLFDFQGLGIVQYPPILTYVEYFYAIICKFCLVKNLLKSVLLFTLKKLFLRRYLRSCLFCFDLPNSLLAGRFHAVILSNSQVRFRDLLSNNSDSAKI